MKKRTILLIVLALLVTAGVGTYFFINAKLQTLKAIPVPEVNLNDKVDGTYIGSYSCFPVSAKVKVTVKNHAITGIEILEHNNGKGKAAEVIPQHVIKAQSLKVDIISGATYSSKVILLAIEDALKHTP